MIPFCEYCVWLYRCDDISDGQGDKICEWFTPIDDECILQEYDGRFYYPEEAHWLHLREEMGI